VQKLTNRVKALKNTPIFSIIESRIKDFEKINSLGEKKWFDELCFCLLTANFSAKGSIKIQENIGDGFRTLNEPSLAKRLAELGHRYPNARANYIVLARQHLGSLKKKVTGFENGRTARVWLQEIKGLGMKEASHFLRNVGYKDVSILDKHILNLLFENHLINSIKMTPKRYVEIEKIMDKLSEKFSLDHARLDLYLWYLKTGQVLK